MVRTDEDALICDFAETYHIYDYKAVPLRLRATLAVGLRPDSRIKLKMIGYTEIPTTVMLARLADDVSMYRYGWTKDAEKGKNKPVLFTQIMAGDAAEPKKQEGFKSGEEFLAAWNKS